MLGGWGPLAEPAPAAVGRQAGTPAAPRRLSITYPCGTAASANTAGCHRSGSLVADTCYLGSPHLRSLPAAARWSLGCLAFSCKPQWGFPPLQRLSLSAMKYSSAEFSRSTQAEKVLPPGQTLPPRKSSSSGIK